MCEITCFLSVCIIYCTVGYICPLGSHFSAVFELCIRIYQQQGVFKKPFTVVCAFTFNITSFINTLKTSWRLPHLACHLCSGCFSLPVKNIKGVCYCQNIQCKKYQGWFTLTVPLCSQIEYCWLNPTSCVFFSSSLSWRCLSTDKEGATDTVNPCFHPARTVKSM